MKFFDLRMLGARLCVGLDTLQRCHESGIAERDWLLDEESTRPHNSVDRIEAVQLACATLLLKHGFSFNKMKLIVYVICRCTRMEDNPLHLPFLLQAIQSAESAVVQIADGKFVRWKIDNCDSGWVRFEPNYEKAPSHEPHFVVALDIVRIGQAVDGLISLHE